MDYYFLDSVSWQRSQAIYHAAAELGREALFVLRPSSPYVCIGYHQDAEQEIDLDFAATNSIPVFRRRVGGGAVYLDGDQLFYQFIVRRKRPGVPANIADFYRTYLQPVVDTYREFGVAAEYKPVNDIVANGRKVSGNGAAEIENMLVLVGNFILDFDYEMMAKVLRVPDEKFRDKLFRSLSENLSTIRRETGSYPSTEQLANTLVRFCQPILGNLSPINELDSELAAKADDLFARMYTPEWLHANDRRRLRTNNVKIREGVYVIQNMVKTPGGLLRVTAISDDGYLRDVHISGDFFFYPADELPELENALDGVEAGHKAVSKAVDQFLTERSISSPGLLPQDFGNVLRVPISR